MMAMGSNGALSKFKLMRRGRKLQSLDPQGVLAVLPKDVPERTWADIQQREDTDLFLFELREEIFDTAMEECYEHYMDRQTVCFTAQCAAKAWLRLFDWYFYRHDPGEDPTSYPPCYIPKRVESWTPDTMAEPSPKDPWCRASLATGEVLDQRVTLERWPSNQSLVLPKLPEIPRSCWFPGKVKLPPPEVAADEEEPTESYDYSETSPPIAESEVLQRITDYSNEELTQSYQEESSLDEMVKDTNMEASLQGAGDFVHLPSHLLGKRRGSRFRSHVYSRNAIRQSRTGAGSGVTDSQQTVVSDCRLRSLRLDTQYEISAEQVDSPPAAPRRKS